MYQLAQLVSALNQAGVASVAVTTDVASVPPGSFLATTSDGHTVRLDAVAAGQVSLATATVQAFVWATADEAFLQAVAQSLFSLPDPHYRLLRAVFLTSVDSRNALATLIATLIARLAAQDAVVASATTLANLKTGWAALAALPVAPAQVTYTQGKNSVLNHASSTDTD